MATNRDKHCMPKHVATYPSHTPIAHTDVATQFMEWAKDMAATLRSKGHFADIIDPCSALPVGP